MIRYNDKDYQRAIIIGDIHGCYKEFIELLYKTEASFTNDLVISVGDLLDRGPLGAEVVKFCRETNIITVLGNHECRARRWLGHEAKANKDPTYKNKMKHYSEQDIKAIKALTAEDEAWLNTLPTYIRFEVNDQPYIVVHGGFFPHYSIDKQDPKIVCRLRNIDKVTYQMYPYKPKQVLPETAVFWDEIWPGPEKVIYGHEPRDEVKITQYCFGIDTGCCFNGKLTAMVVNEDNRISFESVPAQAKYSERTIS